MKFQLNIRSRWLLEASESVYSIEWFVKPPPLKICYIYALERYTLQSAKDLFIGLIENLQ
jgi:hypothetical protein